ncbi:MAG: NADH-quinone oxidoreductase subunit H [Alphaproteobacteria bacterium]|jgi:NADH-quinone oxidoreductase subunit H
MEILQPYFDLINLDNILELSLIVAQVLAVTAPLLISVAYLTWAERKVIAGMQLRKGPTHVGWAGLGQPIADAVKLMFKENVIPAGSAKVVYIIAPMMVMVPAIAAWAVIPFDEGIVLSDVNLGVMYLLATSSIGIYGVLMAGWASNSKYPFLGAVRTGAQMISYEVSMGLTVLSVILMSGSMNLSDIVKAQEGMWFMIPAFPMFIVFIISILAETNRAPFDLPEAEAELVSGYFTEYGSMSFSLFFLGEYANMILMSAIAVILFMGGWLPPFDFAPFTWIPGFIWFFAKIAFILFIFLWTRATFPRFRYDQLMRLGWKVFLPFTLFWLVLTAGAMHVFDLV